MRLIALASTSVALASMIVWVACSGDDSAAPGPTSDAGPTVDSAIDGAASGPFALGVPCTDTLASIYGDPGPLPSAKGAIIKCAFEKDISRSDLLARAQAEVSYDDPPATNAGYSGKPFTSGAHVYRILYRTERGDAAKSPGYSSAQVYIPDTPRVAGKLPLLVGSHATWGQGPNCPPDNLKGVPAQGFVSTDYDQQVFPMVGLGYPIIMPDLAGYANAGAPGNPMSAYAQYEDVGKSTLDGARALAKMYPSAFDGKVVLVGHSQGGHSALSALAIQKAYAPDVNVVAVATYSPLWLSQRSWGAILFEADQYPILTYPTANAVSIWYHYTNGELLDGPGHGLDPFAADKKAVIQNFMTADCEGQGWDGGYLSPTFPDLLEAGALATDFFDPAFVDSVANAAALGSGCKPGDAGVACAKWIPRYVEDRPHLSTTVPVLVEYGSVDDTIDPGRMACVLDRFKQDKVNYTFCLHRGTGHGGIPRVTGSDVADWIGSKTLGEPAPPACAETDLNLTDDAGAPIQCTTPPKND